MDPYMGEFFADHFRRKYDIVFYQFFLQPGRNNTGTKITSFKFLYLPGRIQSHTPVNDGEVDFLMGLFCLSEKMNSKKRASWPSPKDQNPAAIF